MIICDVLLMSRVVTLMNGKASGKLYRTWTCTGQPGVLFLPPVAAQPETPPGQLVFTVTDPGPPGVGLTKKQHHDAGLTAF